MNRRKFLKGVIFTGAGVTAGLVTGMKVKDFALSSSSTQANNKAVESWLFQSGKKHFGEALANRVASELA